MPGSYVGSRRVRRAFPPALILLVACAVQPQERRRGPGTDTELPPPRSTTASPEVTPCDRDHDGLEDAVEKRLGTDPDVKDTDGGGVPDGVEHYVRFTDPLFGADDRPVMDTDGDGADDLRELLGSDETLCTGDETDPFTADSDGDGLPDGRDVYPLDPDLPDPDPDFVPNCKVMDHMTDPEFDDSHQLVAWHNTNEKGEASALVARVDPISGAILRNSVYNLGPIVGMHVARNGPEWMTLDGEPAAIFSVTDPDSGEMRVHTSVEGPHGSWVTTAIAGPQIGVGPFGTRHGVEQPPWVRYTVLDEEEPEEVTKRESWARLFHDPSTQVLLGHGIGAHRFTQDILGAVVNLDVDGVQQTHFIDLAEGHVGETTQLTTSAPAKEQAFVWFDPYLGRLLLLTVHRSGLEQAHAIAIYDFEDAESPLMVLPSPLSRPYVVSPEFFLFEGRSYLTWLASEHPPAGPSIGGNTGAADAWVASIDVGGARLVRRLHDQGFGRPKDPEPFAGEQTAWVYFRDLQKQRNVRCMTGL